MDATQPAVAVRFLAAPDTVRARLRPILLAALLLAALALLSWLSGTDLSVAAAIAASPLAGFGRPACDVYSHWGPYLFYLPLLAVFALGLARRQRLPRDIGFTYLAAQGLGAVLLTHLLKVGVARLRPHASPDAATGWMQLLHSSFPSSHTVDVAIGAFLVLCLVRSRALQAFALTLAVLMGIARLGLGKHYLSDVLAGLALGAATVALLVRVYLLPRWQRSVAAGR
jgi:undecaprenyl-diphosphatase